MFKVTYAHITYIAILFPFICNIATASTPTRKDFAFGISIAAKENQLYEFSVPEHIYSKVQHHNLSDLRVFAPDDTLIPYVIIEQKPVTTKHSQSIQDVTIFPVRQMASQPINDLNLFVKRDAEGTIVNINTTDNNPANNNKNTFYVVDLGKNLDANLNTLQLQWNTDSVEQTNLTIETSTDLTTWKNAGNGAIMHLTQDGQTLSRNKIPIKRLSRYLKVYSNTHPKWQLLKLQTVIDTSVQQEKTLNWNIAKIIKKLPNRFIYQVSPGYPLHSIHIIPAQASAIHHIQVMSGNTPEKMITQQYRGLTYRMTIGNEDVSSNAIIVSNYHHTLWQVEIFDKDNQNHDPPEFKVSWYPHLIRFLSSSPGNYTVAYGNADLTHHGTSLPPSINEKRFEAIPADISSPVALGGESKLSPTAPVSYTQPILWSILVLVLIVMGFMVYRLTKHMK